MAGDWIKMRVDLTGDPAVVRMAADLSLDRFAVVGRLHAVWAWADAHADCHGAVTLVSHDWIDTLSQTAGFARAMESVGWLAAEGAGLRFPRFDRHMGASGKARATAAARQQRHRAAKSSGDPEGTPAGGRSAPRGRHAPVTEASRSDRDETVTREEKRREESKDPPNPPRPGGTEGDASSPPAGKARRRKAAESPPRARPSVHLVDALAEVTGSDPALTGQLLGAAASALAGADPPYTPAEVREFGRRFHELCTWAAKDNRARPTVPELQKHIGLLRAGKPKSAPPVGRSKMLDVGRLDPMPRPGKPQAPPSRTGDHDER